jgi:hypothetical protein
MNRRYPISKRKCLKTGVRRARIVTGPARREKRIANFAEQTIGTANLLTQSITCAPLDGELEKLSRQTIENRNVHA